MIVSKFFFYNLKLIGQFYLQNDFFELNEVLIEMKIRGKLLKSSTQLLVYSFKRIRSVEKTSNPASSLGRPRRVCASSWPG
jgi:hypothetical protein